MTQEVINIQKSKRKEAELRLCDHLERFSSITMLGQCIDKKIDHVGNCNSESINRQGDKND